MNKSDRRAKRRREVPAGLRRRAVVAVMLGPAAVGLVVFTLAPLAFVAAWSLTNYDLVSPPTYTGLDNYRFALDGDPFLGQAVRNTGWMLAIGVPLQLCVALGLSVLLIRRDRLTAVARTAVFLPSVLPPVAATLAFGWLLEPVHGPVNQLIGALGLPAPLWFHDPQWAKPGLLLLGLWGVGPAVIVFIGGMVRIPVCLYESARLEGAGSWQRLRYVTLPMLRPVILFTTVIGLVGALQYFTQAYVAAASTTPGLNAFNGAPEGSTRFYATWLFRQAFQSFHVGYASMLAWVLFLAAGTGLAVFGVAARRSTSIGTKR